MLNFCRSATTIASFDLAEDDELLASTPSSPTSPNFLDRAVKTLDVLNAASLTLASLALGCALRPGASCLLAPTLHCAPSPRRPWAIARIFADDSGVDGPYVDVRLELDLTSTPCG